MIPYSRKFSLVQNFMELFVIPLEEKVVVLISRLLTFSCLMLQTISCTGYAMMSPFHRSFKFSQFLFSWQLICQQKTQILHHAKISCCTAVCVCVLWYKNICFLFGCHVYQLQWDFYVVLYWNVSVATGCGRRLSMHSDLPACKPCHLTHTRCSLRTQSSSCSATLGFSGKRE